MEHPNKLEKKYSKKCARVIKEEKKRLKKIAELKKNFKRLNSISIGNELSQKIQRIKNLLCIIVICEGRKEGQLNTICKLQIEVDLLKTKIDKKNNTKP